MLRKIMFAVALALGLGGGALVTGAAQAAVAQGAPSAVDPARAVSPATMQFAYYYYPVRHRYYHRYGYYRPRYYRPRYYRPYYYRPCRVVWVTRWSYGRRYVVRRRVCY